MMPAILGRNIRPSVSIGEMPLPTGSTDHRMESVIMTRIAKPG